MPSSVVTHPSKPDSIAGHLEHLDKLIATVPVNESGQPVSEHDKDKLLILKRLKTDFKAYDEGELTAASFITVLRGYSRLNEKVDPRTGWKTVRSISIQQLLDDISLELSFSLRKISDDDRRTLTKKLNDAVIENDSHRVTLLLKCGANVDGIGTYESPLFLALQEEASIEIIQLLLAYDAATDCLNGIKRSALFVAAFYNRADVIELLQSKGIITIRDYSLKADSLLDIIKLEQEYREKLKIVLGISPDECGQYRTFLNEIKIEDLKRFLPTICEFYFEKKSSEHKNSFFISFISKYKVTAAKKIYQWLNASGEGKPKFELTAGEQWACTQEDSALNRIYTCFLKVKAAHETRSASVRPATFAGMAAAGSGLFGKPAAKNADSVKATATADATGSMKHCS